MGAVHDYHQSSSSKKSKDDTPNNSLFFIAIALIIIIGIIAVGLYKFRDRFKSHDELKKAVEKRKELSQEEAEKAK